jgi:type II secretory pathway pseudopilin PulG
MATPTQVPAPPQPRPLFVWLMRAGCIAFIATLAAFAFHAPDLAVLDTVVICIFLVLAAGKGSENWLKATFGIATVAFVVMLFVLLFPWMTDVRFERIETVLLVASNVALLVTIAGAVLAYRSVPKEVWLARRTPPPLPVDPAQVRVPFGWAARLVALAILVAPFLAMGYLDRGVFTAYCVLFVIPYLVFILNPVRLKWLAWGQGLPITVGITSGLLLIPTVFSAFEQKHLSRGDRVWLALLITIFVLQPVLFLLTRRTYAQRVPFGGRVGQGFIYYFCVLLFVAATLPSILPARRSGNESTAAGSLRTIHTVATTYQTQYPDVGYPPSLKVLGACTAPPTKDATCLVDANLGCPTGACVKSGYRFTYKPVIKDGVVVHFAVVARPTEYEETGTRSFYLDDDGTIHATTDDRDATANDPPL